MTRSHHNDAHATQARQPTALRGRDQERGGARCARRQAVAVTSPLMLHRRAADAETALPRSPGAGLVVRMRENAGLALIRPVKASALVGGARFRSARTRSSGWLEWNGFANAPFGGAQMQASGERGVYARPRGRNLSCCAGGGGLLGRR
jgi:hypothetical protein